MASDLSNNVHSGEFYKKRLNEELKDVKKVFLLISLGIPENDIKEIIEGKNLLQQIWRLD